MVTARYEGKILTRSLSRLKAAYHLLNLLSGFLELGGVVFLALHQQSILSILLSALAYQVGNLAASTLGLSKSAIRLVSAGSVICIITYLATGILPFYFAAIALASVIVQKTRRYIVSLLGPNTISTFSKRLLRILGFLAAGLAIGPSILAACLAIAIVVNAVASLSDQPYPQPVAMRAAGWNGLSSIMVIHQSHYFCYAYWLPILFLDKLAVPDPLVGLLFVLGWLSYIYSEKVFGGYPLKWVFILGHLTVTVSLVLMGLLTRSLPAVLIAWFVSGLGGGTVFALKKLNKGSKEPVDMDFWEDLGHVSGTLISVFVAAIFQTQYSSVFWAAALIAVLTALWMGFRKGEPVQAP